MLIIYVIIFSMSLFRQPAFAQEKAFRDACAAAGAPSNADSWIYRSRCYVYHGHNDDTQDKAHGDATVSCTDLGAAYPGHLVFNWGNDELRTLMEAYKTCTKSDTWTGAAKPRGDAASYGKWYWEHPDGRKWHIQADSREAGYLKWFSINPNGVSWECCTATVLCPGGDYGFGDYPCQWSLNYLCEYEPKESSLRLLAANKRIDPAKLPPTLNFSVASLHQCLGKCVHAKNHPICYSVVYGSATGECELHTAPHAPPVCEYVCGLWTVNDGSRLLLGADAAYPDAPWAVDALGYDIYTFA